MPFALPFVVFARFWWIDFSLDVWRWYAAMEMFRAWRADWGGGFFSKRRAEWRLQVNGAAVGRKYAENRSGCREIGARIAIQAGPGAIRQQNRANV